MYSKPGYEHRRSYTVSSDLFKNISLFHVEDRDESVHYPLKCILSLPVPAQELHLEEHACDPRVKYSWDESKIDSFMTKFRERYNSQYDRILFTINENVEDASNMFIELFCSAAVNSFACKPWWDTVCESFRNRKIQALRLLRIMGNMINLAEYLNIRNNYKDLCRNIKREYENKQRQKLVDSRKKYINFLEFTKDQCYQYKSNSHPLTWLNYFKDLFSLYMQNEMGDTDMNYTPVPVITLLLNIIFDSGPIPKN